MHRRPNHTKLGMGQCSTTEISQQSFASIKLYMESHTVQKPGPATFSAAENQKSRTSK